MHKRTDQEWCVEFWDFDSWNEWANTRHGNKNHCIDLAQRMNKDMNPQHPDSPFQGHRFRVRKVRTK